MRTPLVLGYALLGVLVLGFTAFVGCGDDHAAPTDVASTDPMTDARADPSAAVVLDQIEEFHRRLLASDVTGDEIRRLHAGGRFHELSARIGFTAAEIRARGEELRAAVADLAARHGVDAPSSECEPCEARSVEALAAWVDSAPSLPRVPVYMICDIPSLTHDLVHCVSSHAGTVHGYNACVSSAVCHSCFGWGPC